jgi:copper transport protein
MTRRLLVAATLVVAFAWVAPSAGAHAVLVRSQPADTASLDGAPRHVALRFSEAISTRFGLVRLLDGRGHVVAGTRLRPGDGSRALVLDLPRLHRGTYEVTWEVLAQDDGHITGGAIVFGVGVPAGTAPRRAPDASPSTLEAGLRWLDFALYALVVGGLVVSLLLLREKSASRVSGGQPPAAEGRVLAGSRWSAGAALALGGVLLVRQAVALPSEATLADTIGRLLGTRWGVLWLAREILFAVLVAAVVALRGRVGAKPRTPTVAYVTAGCAAAALAVIRALGGHGAAVAAPGAHVAADAVHVLAAAVWMGGVAAFAFALWPSGAMSRGQALAAARACRRPFAWVAGLSVAVVGATGFYSAGAQVASVDALLTTGYGQELVAKSALVVVAGALGLANARLLRRGSRRAVRIMLAEGAVGLGILLAAAEMTATSPPRGPEFDAPRPVRAPALAGRVDDVLVSATARPNRPGTNVFTVLAVSSRRPPPAAIDRVTLLVSGPDAERARRAVPLASLGRGRWSGGMRVGEPGSWRMTVEIRRGGQRLTSSALRWTVAPADTARPVSVSARRLAPLLDRAAILIALALAAGAVALAIGRLRRPIDPLRREAT